MAWMPRQSSFASCNQPEGELDGLRENASKDMEDAYKCDPSLAEEAASGKPERARDAMICEAEV